MQASKIQELLSKIIKLNKEQDVWLEKLPIEISSAFFDNTYVTAKSLQIDTLINFIFEDWSEDVSYFLYEPSPHCITTIKGEYVINNIDEYIDYMIVEGFATEDRK
jgi:hypothetical protein